MENYRKGSGAEQRPNIQLDSFNSDLNFIVHDSGLSGSSHRGAAGFGYMWAGARANRGAKRGRVCFEATVTSHVAVNMDDTPEELQHLARFGWSVPSLSYCLGEEKKSYGYGGTGKSSVNKSFADYGEKFGLNDTITCYLDMESSPITISYAKNGRFLGKASNASVGNDEALFPHVLVKNVGLHVNFGSSPPRYPVEEGYCMLEHAEMGWLAQGPIAPVSFNACTVMMMVGLPASGKTTWARKYQSEHADQRYTILGTNDIMEQMRVNNLMRKRNYHGRFDQLMQLATKVHGKLMDICKHRKRNFILDQTNVYSSARQRKINNFRQFGERQAVALIVTDDELGRRTSQRERKEGKLVPDSAVKEMKRNFVLPTLKEGFTSVLFPEEPEESARSIVASYASASLSKNTAQSRSSEGTEPAAKRRFSGSQDASEAAQPPSLLGEYKRNHARGSLDRPGLLADSNSSGPERQPLMDRPPPGAPAATHPSGHYEREQRGSRGAGRNRRHRDGGDQGDRYSRYRTDYGHGPGGDGAFSSPADRPASLLNRAHPDGPPTGDRSSQFDAASGHQHFHRPAGEDDRTGNKIKPLLPDRPLAPPASRDWSADGGSGTGRGYSAAVASHSSHSTDSYAQSGHGASPAGQVYSNSQSGQAASSMASSSPYSQQQYQPQQQAYSNNYGSYGSSLLSAPSPHLPDQQSNTYSADNSATSFVHAAAAAAAAAGVAQSSQVPAGHVTGQAYSPYGNQYPQQQQQQQPAATSGMLAQYSYASTPYGASPAAYAAAQQQPQQIQQQQQQQQ
eukprot:scpid42563/ scgid34787/ Heterogeneous nuclear ribonucleoprotein U-like protein 1; Adenovirus early region 1B-associated protein 5; E1B-55 kDa-associated protein 5